MGSNLQREVAHPNGNYTLFDPLSGNYDCSELTVGMKEILEDYFTGDNGLPSWDNMANARDEHSCDQVLDSDSDGLFNLEEEAYGTNPNSPDSDGDLLTDIQEISNSTILYAKDTGQNCGVPLIDPVTRAARSHLSLLNLDYHGSKKTWMGMARIMVSDWDTDGDGMPDGFEFCYSMINDHPAYNTAAATAGSHYLTLNNSDGYGDWDEDGMNNIEEYQVAWTFGEEKFTSPWHKDTDEDGMPDGWEANNGLDPRDGSNGDEDPDRDGYDVDGDGSVTYDQLENTAKVININVAEDDYVDATRQFLHCK